MIEETRIRMGIMYPNWLFKHNAPLKPEGAIGNEQLRYRISIQILVSSIIRVSTPNTSESRKEVLVPIFFGSDDDIVHYFLNIYTIIWY